MTAAPVGPYAPDGDAGAADGVWVPRELLRDVWAIVQGRADPPLWGRVEEELERLSVYPSACPRCRGTGGGEYNDCSACDGNGVV